MGFLRVAVTTIAMILVITVVLGGRTGLSKSLPLAVILGGVPALVVCAAMHALDIRSGGAWTYWFALFGALPAVVLTVISLSLSVKGLFGGYSVDCMLAGLSWSMVWILASALYWMGRAG
jgi:hypothetical protein